MKTKGQFNITAKTYTLMFNEQENGATILGNNINYIVPIYQRPYSWSEEQIKKFIGDIFLSYWGNDHQIICDPLFIGTMQLSEFNIAKNEYQVIDGQQRLSTFLILFKVLQIEFPNCQVLSKINLNWLRTKVNNGTQQSDFSNFLAVTSFENSTLLGNKYMENAFIMNNLLKEFMDEHESDSDEQCFDIDHFLKYLTSKIYFVVIETQASLSKTLQIFNAINTTGLDLNGGDIFKLRMYEYLCDKNPNFSDDERNKIFESISSLYELIDNNNKVFGWVTDISGILEIFKYVIIARFDLPKNLFFYETNRFFDELFDSISDINRWENFKTVKEKNIELEIKDIEQIIINRYKWHELNQSLPTAEVACAWSFIWWSRYSRYHILIYIFSYRFNNTNDFEHNLFYFIKQLNKLFLIYSIRFQKIKSEIYYSFMYEVIDCLINKSFDELIELINNQIGTIQSHKGGYDIETTLNGDITYNSKLKNIICRLSAMLDEDYSSNDISIRNKLFHQPIDIEHIQSFHDKNGNVRQKIWDSWGDHINSIGNLMVLEQNINRSISNSFYFEKIESYPKSKFQIVKRQISNFKKWELTDCQLRKEKEVNKILNYLFSK
jgi:uncharacterized protein with ParB-like and HNH nuclease domain